MAQHPHTSISQLHRPDRSVHVSPVDPRLLGRGPARPTAARPGAAGLTLRSPKQVETHFLETLWGDLRGPATARQASRRSAADVATWSTVREPFSCNRHARRCCQVAKEHLISLQELAKSAKARHGRSLGIRFHSSNFQKHATFPHASFASLSFSTWLFVTCSDCL